ncbi:MAG: helix-turn-helix transcriptional regulator [Nitrospirales bacterium]|nr:helix-turn-helix transcriptional regulator [Nitrospira sp.]MDR4502737.1 helix-turn-helix transcriptional regulator [Nitrospirales bacterium]
MARTINEVISSLPKVRQKRITKRSKEMVEEYMALQEIRKARELTQKDVAKKLKISQDGVSRLEQRTDVMLSTLRKYVEAMGGSLNLVAQFPDRPPVEIAGFSDTPKQK